MALSSRPSGADAGKSARAAAGRTVQPGGQSKVHPVSQADDTARTTRPVDTIAYAYVEDYCTLDPVTATYSRCRGTSTA